MKKLWLLLVLAGITLGARHYYAHSKREAISLRKKLIRSNISSSLFEKDELIANLDFGEDKYKIKYTIDDELEDYAKQLLRRYRTDHSVIVVIDNDNANILTAIDYQGKNRKFGRLMAFTSTHPSASLFKIVTAVELLENTSVDPETVFRFKGRGTTLYKYQLRAIANAKRGRRQTFNKAFAYSNNVIFGKAAVNFIEPVSLFETAQGLGFNEDFMADLQMGSSVFLMPEDQYNLAELASGFNRKTMVSPIHAAMLSYTVARKGMWSSPQIVKEVYDETVQQVIWEPQQEQRVAFSVSTAEQIERLMTSTVKMGTASSVFRKMRRKIKNNLIIGGKTGSITGGMPYGKRDWFTAFAIPKDSESKGISVAVMNVNGDKWYVRSTYLARKIIEFYFAKKASQNNDQLRTAKL